MHAYYNENKEVDSMVQKSVDTVQKYNIDENLRSNIDAGFYHDDAKSQSGGYNREIFAIDQLSLSESDDDGLIKF